MPGVRHVLMRESILKAVEGAGRDGVPVPDLERVVEPRLHADVFPRGGDGLVPRVRDELLASGLLAEEAGRYRLASPERAPDAWRAVHADWFDALGGLVRVDGNLHRSPLPFTREHFRALRTAGVRVVFSMEALAPADLAREEGLDLRRHDWLDNGRPTLEEMDRFVEDALSLPAHVGAVVHCKAGLGRTGMALACAVARRRRWGAEKALAHYWDTVPLARHVMERFGQADFVREYVAFRG